MSQARAEEIMRLYLTEVLANRRFELIPEFATNDMVDHTREIPGPAGLDAHARGFCERIPGVESEVERIFASDDTAVGIWRRHGTPTEPMDLNTAGDPVHPQRIARIFKIRNRMLVDYEVFVDAGDILSQIAAPAVEAQERQPARCPIPRPRGGSIPSQSGGGGSSYEIPCARTSTRNMLRGRRERPWGRPPTGPQNRRR